MFDGKPILLYLIGFFGSFLISQHSFDVDDIIMNTLGGVLGYLVYVGSSLLFKKKINLQN